MISRQKIFFKKYFFEKRARFFQRFGFPFAILILFGVILYLGSVIGEYHTQESSIQALIDDSEPRSVFVLPHDVRDKNWARVQLGVRGFEFRYPANWRIFDALARTIIREGEGATVSLDVTEADTAGESMIAYRVARIAALSDLGYRVTDISQAVIHGEKALILTYENMSGEALFYDTIVLRRGMFYSVLLAVKKNQMRTHVNDIVDEYRRILATVSFE